MAAIRMNAKTLAVAIRNFSSGDSMVIPHQPHVAIEIDERAESCVSSCVILSVKLHKISDIS